MRTFPADTPRWAAATAESAIGTGCPAAAVPGQRPLVSVACAARASAAMTVAIWRVRPAPAGFGGPFPRSASPSTRSDPNRVKGTVPNARRRSPLMAARACGRCWAGSELDSVTARLSGLASADRIARAVWVWVKDTSAAMKVMVSAVVRTPAVSAVRAGPMRLITSGMRRVVTPLPSYPSISAGRAFGCRSPGADHAGRLVLAGQSWPAISGNAAAGGGRARRVPGQGRRAPPPRRRAPRGWNNDLMPRPLTSPCGKLCDLIAAASPGSAR